MFRRKHFSGLPTVIFILSVPLGDTGKFHHRSEFYTKYNATKALLTFIFIFFHTLFPLSLLPWLSPSLSPFPFPSGYTHTHTHTTEGLHFHFSLSLFLSCIGEGNGNPLQCSCLESPRDEGAWWAAIYGVAESRTRLKRLSSRSSIYIYIKYSHNVYTSHLLTFFYLIYFRLDYVYLIFILLRAFLFCTISLTNEPQIHFMGKSKTLENIWKKKNNNNKTHPEM